jgi:hypothetical protein
MNNFFEIGFGSNSYLKKNILWNLKTRRNLQLKIESDIDNKLTENLDKCPETISKFLLYMRRVNRIHFMNLSECSIFQYTDMLEKNLDHIDNINQKLINNLEYNLCEYLETIIKNKN